MAEPADTHGAAITATVKRVKTIRSKVPIYRLVWAITGTNAVSDALRERVHDYLRRPRAPALIDLIPGDCVSLDGTLKPIPGQQEPLVSDDWIRDGSLPFSLNAEAPNQGERLPPSCSPTSLARPSGPGSWVTSGGSNSSTFTTRPLIVWWRHFGAE